MATPDSTYRFSLAKDIKEWIDISQKEPWWGISWSDEKTWKYEYLGDKKFLPYMSLYTSEIEQFSKYFPDMDIWLKNIYWDSLFTNAESLIDQILSKIEKDPTFSIVHLFPLEMAIVWEVIKSIGGVNLVYNINRIPAINSISKTLEASLFLVSWKQIEWLNTRMEKLISLYKEKYLWLKLSDHFFLFDENDTVPIWNISRIDNYVKWAIGFKESIITYHTEELPSKDFLIKNGYKSVVFSDTDNSHGIDEYYTKNIGTIFYITKNTLQVHTSENIGYYEDYVVEKNTEYLKYRKDILSATSQNKIHMGTGGGTEKWKKNYSGGSSPINTLGNSTLSLKEWAAYLGGLALLLPLFLMLEASHGRAWFTPTTSTSSGTSGWWNSYRSSSWGSSFKSSSSSSSSSSVSSFWGWGFSKWGG